MTIFGYTHNKTPNKKELSVLIGRFFLAYVYTTNK